MIEHKKIDLNEARTSRDSRVLSGRERGSECRRKFEITRIDKSTEEAIVSIPRDIYSVNTSFFLGLFGESVRFLGKEGFRTKYKFDCDDIHLETIADGIERAVKEATIFSKKSA